MGADKFLAAGCRREERGAGAPPRSSERYLQPAVKPPSGDGAHAGRHAGALIRLDRGVGGQARSAGLRLREPPTGKTVQVTMGRERQGENSLG